MFIKVENKIYKVQTISDEFLGFDGEPKCFCETIPVYTTTDGHYFYEWDIEEKAERLEDFKNAVLLPIAP